ncbi:MAG: AsmA family protein [Bauldia sp.]|uniref:AsmA family protein n=1 Tax=Bauldia sp. TaxID=2575872 RepID=UPI001D9A7B79|nr:AsmA family protein [Bauldia sp.]MCB1494556.1 AsmA family protein [Bauldia sp.]
MRKLLIGLVVVVVVIVGALFALPLLIPSDTIKGELIATIEEATGRDIRIDGPVSVSILPTPHLSAEGIGIAGLAGDSDAFRVDSVSFGVSLIPLLSGNVEITGVTIERPQILVAYDEDGIGNWEGVAETAAADAAPAPASNPESIEDLIAAEPAPPPADQAAGDALAALENLTIGRVSIVDGTVTYSDARSGTKETIEALNLDIRMPEMVGAGTIDGSFAYGGVEQKVSLALAERPAAQLLERIPVELTLSNDGGSLTAKGTALDGTSLIKGSMEATGSSLAGFLKGYGVDLPDAPAFEAFTLSSPLEVDDASVLLSQFKGEIGGIPLDGALQLVYDRPTPGIGMKLAAGKIDTALFTPKTVESGDGGGEGGGGGGSDGALDLSALGALDANVDFTASEIVLGSAALANLAMDLKLAGSVLTTTIRSVEISGAPGSGAVTVDARQPAPAISGSAKLAGLDLAGLMALAGTNAPATGLAGLNVDFQTTGATVDQLVANLKASGAASLTNGALTGLALAEYVGGDKSADKIEDIDVKVSFPSLDSPVSVDGALTWRGERFTIAAKGDARALAEGKETQVSLTAKSTRLNLGFAGTASPDGFGTGKVALSTPSLRKLLAWIGQPMSGTGGLGPFSIDGTVSLEADRFTFDRAAFSLDSSSGLGTGAVVFADRPKVTAGLAMKVLDVTPYLVASGTTARKGGNGGGGGGGGGGGSDAPVDFSGLKAFDADLNLRADRIIADDIEIGKSSLTVKVAGGKLNANLTEMALYSGSGTGAVTVDGAAATPAMAASFKLAKVSARDFLADAIGFKRIEGAGSFNFDLQAAGKSQSALMKSLSGKGAMAVRKGAISGIDIPKMLKSLSINSLLGWQPGKDKTEFSQIDATFTVTKGILTNKDLVMAGPEFALQGAGTIDIPAQTVSYTLNAQVASGKKGQLKDFAVPIHVEGPLAKPKIYPDVKGVLENPQGAINQINEITGNILGDTGDKKGGDKNKKNKKKDKNDPVGQVLDLLKQ